MNQEISSDNVEAYIDSDNICYIIKRVCKKLKYDIKQVPDQYIEHITDIISSIKDEYIIKGGLVISIEELNQLTIEIILLDYQQILRQYEKRKNEAFDNTLPLKVLLSGVDMSNPSVNINAFLRNVYRSLTASNLYTGGVRSQLEPEFTNSDSNTTYNIGIMGVGDTVTAQVTDTDIIVSQSVPMSDAVNAAILSTTPTSSETVSVIGSGTTTVTGNSIQSGDKTLTSEEYDEFIVSIDSRNRNVATNKYANHFTIRLLTLQGDERRGAMQGVSKIRNVFDVTLIDAIIPNIISSSSRAFDEPYLLLDIEELRGGNMGTTSFNGNKVFGKLRYDFAKVDDNFLNVYTDDCYKRFAQLQILDNLGAITISIYDYNGNLYNFGTDGMVISLAEAGTTATIHTTEAHTMATGNKVYIYGFRLDNIQKIIFSAVPTGGSWQLNYGTQQTALFAFNATSLTIENALNVLTGVTVTVDGDYTVGFTIVFGTVILNTVLLEVATGSTTPTGTYSLVTGITPIVTTISDITSEYVTEVNNINSDQGHTITNITSTSFQIPVELSYTGRLGYCIIGNRQVTFSIRIRTKGSETHTT